MANIDIIVNARGMPEPKDTVLIASEIKGVSGSPACADRIVLRLGEARSGPDGPGFAFAGVLRLRRSPNCR